MFECTLGTFESTVYCTAVYSFVYTPTSTAVPLHVVGREVVIERGYLVCTRPYIAGYTRHAVCQGLELLISERPGFRPKSRQPAYLAFKIYLHACKIKTCTVFAVADTSSSIM
jgi:hypothetical protein